MPAPIATIIIIGNEVLTGKVEDRNGPWLLSRLRELGVRVRRLCIVPDVPEVIAETIREAAAASDHVFTTGGVGPTHDDVTVAAVARAFSREVVEDPALRALILSHIGSRPGAALRMARVPQGATLVSSPDLRFPVLRMENVWVFPGVPELLRLKFDAIASHLGGVPIEAAALWIDADESEIAFVLDEVVSQYPEVDIGSYPKLRGGSYRVMLTLEGEDKAIVKKVLDDLCQRLPEGKILGVAENYDPRLPPPLSKPS